MFHELRCACDIYSVFSRATSYSTSSCNKLVSFSEVYFSNVKFIRFIAIYYYYYYYRHHHHHHYYYGGWGSEVVKVLRY